MRAQPLDSCAISISYLQMPSIGAGSQATGQGAPINELAPRSCIFHSAHDPSPSRLLLAQTCRVLAVSEDGYFLLNAFWEWGFILCRGPLAWRSKREIKRMGILHRGPWTVGGIFKLWKPFLPVCKLLPAQGFGKF